MTPLLNTIQEGWWRILDTETDLNEFRIPESEYQHDEVGEPMEVGLLYAKNGTKKEKETLGFFDKHAGRTHEDPHKHRFHYQRGLEDRFSPRIRTAYAAFFTALNDINKSARNAALAVAKGIDAKERTLPKEERSYKGSLIGRIRQDRVITRLIRYEDIVDRTTTNGKLLDAQTHRDRCCFTVHHYANARGLFLANRNGTRIWTNETTPKERLIFTGEKFWAVTQGRYGTGILHGVHDSRALDAQQAVNQTQRFVVVSFVHCALLPLDIEYFKENSALMRVEKSRVIE
jgi:hypothetical protein